MRSKEFANDYRYFPEPDLLPVILDEDFIKSVKDLMPELSEEKEKRFIREYKLSDYDANVLSVDPNLSNFFEEVVVRSKNPKLATNWIMGELSAFLNKDNLSILETKVDSINLGNLLSRIEDSTISGKIAKEVFEEMWNSEKSPDEIIQEKGLKQVTDSSEIEKIVNQVLEQNQSQLEHYKAGKDKLFGFFVGQVMKISKGKANPKQVNKILKEKLEE
jgi:aspartyl-tRNA(Asn)/glutamyl-tRNA(Gln) amidotransferase subunit B